MTIAQSYVNRFNLAQRIEHIVLIVSFTTLALTGLPQKYPLAGVSQAMVNLLGGIEAVRIIHRIAATLFILEAVYHVVFVGYHLIVRRTRATMLPGIKDGKDAIDSLRYNFGLSKKAPKMPRFNFMEKMEYWAMIWGLLLMGVTGFMLWNPIATARILPGQFIPAAKVAHGGEAVLAVLAIILWHFYHVHIKQFNKSMFTGKMTRHEMIEEHGEELEMIERGQTHVEPTREVARKRLMLFAPFAAVLTLVMLVALYVFVTYEETALAYVPPAEEVEAFVPQTPTPLAATPTLAPTSEQAAGGEPAALTWNDTIAAVFDDRCARCHGSLGGYNAESYAEAIKAIVPGDADASPLVKSQKGAHPGKFQPDELELIISWINAGAPEQ
jgi:cytochrome b subunit of formate dehydrogenase/mono/diheme cytochrome c family protein